MRASAGPEADAARRKARDTSGDGPQGDGNMETLDVAKNGDTAGKNACARQVRQAPYNYWAEHSITSR